MKFIDRNNFNFQSYKLTAEEYLLKLKEQPKPIVLDLRTIEESPEGTVDSAYRMPHNEFSDCLIQLPPFGAIVLYSNTENSYLEKALKLLWENGFTDIFYVDGGYNAIMAAMFEINDSDAQKIYEQLNQQGKHGILLDVSAYNIEYKFIDSPADNKDYKKVMINDVPIYFEHRKLRLIEGTSIAVKDTKILFDNSRWHLPRDKGSIKDRIQKVLDQQINPMVASHGGYVSLEKVDNDIAYVEMAGGCQGCGLSAVTLKQGVEAAIFQNVPEIAQVLDVTDHTAGSNPYYEAT